MKKLFAVLILICLVCPVDAANIDKQIKTQQKTQSSMQKKIKEYNNIAKQKSQQSKTLLSQLSRLKQNANESSSQMADLERENSRLQVTVKEISNNITRVNQSMSDILKLLRGRLVDIYKFMPNETGLNLIFNAETPIEAVNSTYMLFRFVRYDEAMFEDFSRKEHELIENRKKLEENQSQIEKKTSELQKKREEFNSTIKKTDTLLKNVQLEQKKAEAAAKELENAQKAVGNKINALMKQKKKAKTPAKASTSKGTVKITNVKTTGNGSQVQQKLAMTQTSSTAPSSLAWPVNGTVTMQYGSRIHPTFKTKIFNSGIDIKAPLGTPVKAAAPGEVLYQGWLRGFGQVVIIDHGGDLSTVYAHLSGASVREGSTVKTGTVIGRVGNTGTDSDYGLHFEVRRGGSAQNPMNFLRR